MRHKFSRIFLVVLFIIINGCTTVGNQQIHGVPYQTWQQLTIEQRQLIIDTSLRDALSTQISSTTAE